MAPVALDPFPASLRAQEQIASLKKAAATAPNQYGTEISRLSISELEANSKAKAPVDWNENYSYKEWLPWFDERYKHDDFKDPAYEPFEHTDVGLRALHHLDPRSFLDKAAALDDLSPRFGTSVKGIDVTSLSSDELDQLALYVAERGVVVLEDQHAFINQSPEKIKEFGRHFSPRLHQHQVSGQPRDHPEFHLIYKSHKVELNNYEHRNEHVPTVWHSDVSYELNPPGVTGLFLFSTPDSGGDTLFSDTEEHLRRLSPAFKELLKGLHAEHSGVEQAENAKQGGQGVVKRQPIITTHPVLRTHPVTGRESIYVNKGFTRRIVELKKPESDAILDVLFRLNADAIDAQIRVRWRAGSLVLWDNRRTLHTPTVDFSGESARRHGARITPAAERPFYRRTDE